MKASIQKPISKEVISQKIIKQEEHIKALKNDLKELPCPEDRDDRSEYNRQKDILSLCIANSTILLTRLKAL